MNKELINFIATGISRYGETQEIISRFKDETQKMLGNILENRKDFSRYKVDKDSLFLNTWAKELILNARFDIFLNEKRFSVGIGLDWFENKYQPIPFVWFEDEKRRYIKLNKNYEWEHAKVYSKGFHLGYFEKYEFSDLENIFNLVLDDFFNYNLNQPS